jgi:MSHA biogenesis protein MshM
MYLQHFGLREFPFSITPDTDFFLSTREAQQALNTLVFAVTSGEGFIKITGEVGTGKTLLCRKLIGALGDRYKIAYILNPYRQPMSLFMELCAELDVPLDLRGNVNEYQVLDALIDRVIALNLAGRRVLICLDEVQAMPIETLEALRLITNLETEKRKLLQVIIFGQPELNERLSHPAIRQLRQRITFQHHLTPMSADQVAGYLRHRLLVAGHVTGRLFGEGAIAAIARASQGTPRLVNILANKALLSAYADRSPHVRVQDVRLAARETESVPPARRPAWRWLLAAALSATAAVGVGLAIHFLQGYRI